MVTTDRTARVELGILVVGGGLPKLKVMGRRHFEIRGSRSQSRRFGQRFKLRFTCRGQFTIRS